jgi:SAM-dependent methyltransferase
MVARHGGPGLVVDLGCSFGRVAEVIAAGDRHYVGVDVVTEGLASLAERGHEAHRLDITADDVVAQLAGVAAGRPVAAVLVLDVIEHLPDPDALLAALGELSEAWGDPLIVASVPNVAHRDVAAKLLAGRWDLTDTGLLDRTHLSMFTEARLVAGFSGCGLAAIDADDVVCEAADQHFPEHHPFLAGGTPLAELVKWLRSLPDDTAETYQFVRAFRRRRPGTAAHSAPAGTAAAGALTVVVAGRGGDDDLAGLEDTLVCLAAQDRTDFDVVVPVPTELAGSVKKVIDGFNDGFRRSARAVASDAPSAAGRLNDATAEAAAPLLAFVTAGDVVTADWTAVLIDAAGRHPGAVVRLRSYQRTVTRGGGAALSQTNATAASDERFDLWRHLTANQLPLGSFAVPVALVHHARLRFAPDAPAAEWAFAFLAAMLAGVADVAPIGCVHQRLATDVEASASELADVLGRTPVFVGAGWFARLQGDRNHLAYLTHELAAMTERLEAADDRRRAMDASLSWRMTAPLRRGAAWMRARRPG